jgi:putative protease
VIAAKQLELVCPAGTPAAFRAAIDAGAHTIYCGFNDETNARNFPGLNFSREEMADSIKYAHRRGAKTLIAINTFPRAGGSPLWKAAIDDAARLGADAVILADLGLLDYASSRYPGLRLHLSVQAAAANADAVQFYARSFGVKRVVLPRVLTVQEIAAINRDIDVETEVFIFGGLCVMAEGRCSLSSYATGKSPNMNGACSPASHVDYREEEGELVSRLGGFAIHRVAAGLPSPYPTLCKGFFEAGDYRGHVFEDPSSLDAASLIPQLAEAGVTALKIEGRQRSRAYTETVVRSFRKALDAYATGQPIVAGQLRALTEGQQTTSGSYRKTWR